MGVPPSGQEHVDRYSETDGEEGHNWHGTAELLLTVQVKADHHTARARFATAEEKPELWRKITATGAPYDKVPGQRALGSRARLRKRVDRGR
jgi:hypothetical protein